MLNLLRRETAVSEEKMAKILVYMYFIGVMGYLWCLLDHFNILEFLASYTFASIIFMIAIYILSLLPLLKPISEPMRKISLKVIFEILLAFMAGIFFIFLFFILRYTIFLFLIFIFLVTATIFKTKRFSTKKPIKILLFGNLVLFMTLIFLVELTYQPSHIFQQNASTCTLSNAWNLTYRYNYSFFNTYGKPLPKPRLFYIYSLIIPNSLNFYFRKSTIANLSREFAEKLAATSRTGACEDFALGLTRILRDSLHCQTRIVAVYGEQIDHALPEVKINDTWYILDIIFTTPNHPVKASDYATYLFENRRDIYQKIRNITDYDTNEDLRVEHGFINKG